MRSTLHRVLRAIDDDLVPLDQVVGVFGLDGLGILLRADWLRLVSFERGIGHVLWAGAPDDAIARLDRDAGSATEALLKLTPTGANALRAMDGPPPALAAFYEQTAEPVIEAEVDAVTRLALVPAGLVPPPAGA